MSELRLPGHREGWRTMKKTLIKDRGYGFPLADIDLSAADDKDLLEISSEFGLALSLSEMKTIRRYFKECGRNPTDVELQSLGQAWSEHCCYKSSKKILREFIFGIDRDYVIARGDAGVVEFDDGYAYALRIESHNHPSAVEPYGGAATGIGGIVRDVLAMGCQPIALIDPLFFGNLDTDVKNLMPGVKHPKYLFSGVVAGIRDYGNRIGIPTVSGGVCFHEKYTGNCLVNVGCVGIAKKENVLRNAVKNIGDILVLAGGRTGRDGIHGVTFASRVLTEKSDEEDRGAVQLGDPITKEPLIHAVLDANEAGLLTGLKDLGGGGLSCVVGEMTLAAGFGAEVELDKVPLKEDGLAPWEIWVSESQERMMLAVAPSNLNAVLEIFKLYGVDATPIGKVIGEKRVRLYYRKKLVFDIDLEFLTKGPEYCRKYIVGKKSRHGGNSGRGQSSLSLNKDYEKTLLRLLSDPNISCRDWVIRQYDHEVRGCTVIKPLQGTTRSPTHGDAVVLKPVETSYRGLALAVAFNPFVTAIDPYIGGKTIMDEFIRNITAVGAVPHSFTNCLNFGNPEIPERLGEFYSCVKGIAEIASAFGIPSPSGNVSFYNESAAGAILPTATVLGAGIIKDIRKAVTTDFKAEGNSIYAVGKTTDELGGSALCRLFKMHCENVPDVDTQVLKRRMKYINSVIVDGVVAACHDISDGGLAVAISECCIGGSIGADIEIPGYNAAHVELFGETPSRWIMEVKRGMEPEFESRLRGIDIHYLGKTGGSRLSIRADGKHIIDLPIPTIERTWRKTLWEMMG